MQYSKEIKDFTKNNVFVLPLLIMWREYICQGYEMAKNQGYLDKEIKQTF